VYFFVPFVNFVVKHFYHVTFFMWRAAITPRNLLSARLSVLRLCPLISARYQRTSFFLPFLAVLLLLLLSQTSAFAATNVSGTISTNTTWTLAGSPYIVTASVHVNSSSGPVLTIEPGVTVKFSNNTGLTIGGVL